MCAKHFVPNCVCKRQQGSQGEQSYQTAQASSMQAVSKWASDQAAKCGQEGRKNITAPPAAMPKPHS